MIFLLYIIFVLYIIIFLFVTGPAIIGKSFGLREAYAFLLIKIFEWGAKDENCLSEDGEQEVKFSLYDEDNLNAERLGLRKRHSSESLGIIKKEKTESIQFKLKNLDHSVKECSVVKLIVDDSFDFITAGIESIIEDEVTSRFRAQELASWNLLTRTSSPYVHINWYLTFLWLSGFIFRYFILLPMRILVLISGFTFMILVSFICDFVNDERRKKILSRYAILTCMRILCRSVSAIVRFHNRENKATNGGICVANHTSPTDILILSCDNSYAMVGQRQGGALGMFQKLLAKSADHIWFERSEASDRLKVLKRLKEHVDDPTKLPIIIFPEGTCINNTSVMMFKKGSFEIGSTIYPIAMKYDLRLGDAFWNSSEQSYGECVLRMMTSWAIMCDVWYLPPMNRLNEESAIEFAHRVKHAIAKKGGLVDLEWDGQLKRTTISPKLIAEYQNLYWNRLSKQIKSEDPSVSADSSNVSLRSPSEKLSVSFEKTN